ncbi:MAG: hypothetical protein ACLT8E_11035 [Akkermansia sp.]
MELDHRISTEDFERIEEEMKKVVKENQPFQRVISAEAMKMAESGNWAPWGPATAFRFKIDLLNDIPEDERFPCSATVILRPCAGPRGPHETARRSRS